MFQFHYSLCRPTCMLATEVSLLLYGLLCATEEFLIIFQEMIVHVAFTHFQRMISLTYFLIITCTQVESSVHQTHTKQPSVIVAVIYKMKMIHNMRDVFCSTPNTGICC
jgi:hypothetical protein